MRYLDGGILEAKAACRVFDLKEGTTRGGVEDAWWGVLGELRERGWGLGGGKGTGVLGGTPAGLGEGPNKLSPL